jgi:hypothetical protein
MIMRMKLAVMALSLATSTPTWADPGTGSDMLDSCRAFLKDPMPSGQTFQAGMCAGYVMGIVDGLMYAQIADPDRTAVCIPKTGYTIGQGVRVLTKYLEDHPEKLNLGISLIALDAYRKAFPCK